MTFDEDVDADATDGSNWSLGGTDAGSLTVSANTDPAGASGTMTLTLSGDLPDTRPGLTLSYARPSTGGVTDGVNQLESVTKAVSDGVAPAVASARATTGTVVTLAMSEGVAGSSTVPGDFSLSGVVSSPTVSSISVSGSTVTLALSGSILASDSPVLAYARTSGSIHDPSSNILADFAGLEVDTSADITPPLIESATATSLDTITVTFDEDVDADATDGSGWSLAGTDAGSLTVSANTDPAGASGTMTLTLSGDLPDTRPDLTLSYARPSTGGVTDGVNQLESVTEAVSDGVAPAVASARATTGTVVTLAMSEGVADSSTVPGDFSLSGVASSPTVSSISVPGSTVTLALSGSILASDSPVLAYARTSGSIHDPSSNILADFAGLEVDTSADITPPLIESATATSLDTITVTFDEDVDADATDGSGWSLAGTDAGSLAISANTDPAGLSGTMTLTLSGDLPDTRPGLTLAYTRPGSGGITDAAAAANRLADSSVAVLDGIAPTASSVDAATSRSIVLEMSEDVASGTAGPGGFTVSVTPGAAPSVSSISVSGSTVTLALSGPLPGGTVSLGYDQGAGDVRDTTTSANQLASFSGVPVGTSGDITPPLIESATATSLDTITVTFDENVDADATDGSNWSLTGTDAGSLTVSANTDPAGASGTMTLTLSGDLPDTRPDLTLSYARPSTGGVTDGVNQLESVTEAVSDGVAPAVASARATTGTVVTLTMSEGVADSSTVPGDFSLSGVASSPTVSSISVSGSTVALALSGSILASDSPVLAYARTSGSIHDPSSNILADFAGLEVDTSADITPPLIESATATSLDTITVTFDENVDADATDGSNWSLAGTDAGSLTISANTDPAGASGTMTLTLSGDLPDTRPDLTLSYARPSTGGVTDGTNQLESTTVGVDDRLAPAVSAARAATDTAITLTISEPVADNSTTPGDFSLSGVASSPSVSSISVSGSTVTLALSDSILASDSPALSYVRTSGSIHDPSSNVLADFAGLEVVTSADITPPEITAARATSLDTITVTFDEDVDADATDGSNWSLAGTDAGSLTISANTDPAGASGTMTLTLSGDLPDTRPGLTLAYTRPGSGGITDAAAAANRLADSSVAVLDGIAPTASSVDAATSRSIVLEMSEDVASGTAGPGGFTISVTPGAAPSVSSISVSGSTVTLALSGPLPGGTVSLGYDQGAGDVRDTTTSANQLASFSGVPVGTSGDITPPLIESATATSLDTITVTFDENVDADATDGSGWSLAGTDAGSLTISANTDPAGASGTMTLTLSGDLPDTRPGLTLSYARPSTGGVTDGTNQLESDAVSVGDGLAPAISAARAATDTAITLTISEPVADNSTTPSDFSLSGVASSPSVSSISVSGSTVTLALSGSILASDSPVLAYARTSGSIHDPSSNVLADFAGLEVDTSADITPPLIESATATSLDTITVTFDEDVDADATDGSNWSLAGTDAGSLTISANTDPAGASGTMTLTLSGDLPDTRPGLTLAYTRPGSGGITDAAAAANRLADSSVAVLDGIAPTASSVDAATSRSIVLEMSEDVASGTAGPGGFTVSVAPGAAPSVSSISVSGSTVTLALSGPLPGGTVSLGYDQGAGDVRDTTTSANQLASFSGVPVGTSGDIAPPEITSATATSLDTITVTFDESVDADATDGSNWSLAGTDAGSLTVSANTDPAGASGTMTLTLSDDLPDTRPGLTLSYARPSTGGVTDGTNQLESDAVSVGDGLAPAISAARAATDTAITLTISEPVADNSTTPGDFSLSGVASSPSVSSISVSGSTVTLALSGSILASDSPALSYVRTSGSIHDPSSNTLADFAGLVVDTSADITPPEITAARATSLDTITVTFDEDVDADATDGSNWSLAGTDAGSLTISANTDPAGASGTMTLTLSGDLPDTRPGLTLSYARPSTGGITDAAAAANRLADSSVAVLDGIAPAASSVDAATSRSIVLEMSEDVASGTAGPGGFTVSVTPGAAPSVSSISVSGSTVTLALSGPLPGGTVSLGYDQGAGDVRDTTTSANQLASFSGVPVGTGGDITPPEITAARATSLDTITVTFDEDVDADATDGSGWSLAGTDAGSLTVSANTDPAGLSGTMTLTLSGDLPDTRPGLTLSYARPSTGGVTDGTNQLESDAVSVGDGLAPAISAARAATDTAITLTISEPVADNSTTPGDFSLSGVASSPTVSSISVSGSTVTLALSGPILASDSPVLAYARTSGSIHDPSSNILADFAGLEVDTSADITPPLIESATATSLDTITVTFDEDVDADATDGSGWSLAGTDAGSLAISANTDPAGLSGTMTLTLSGDLPDTRPDLTLAYTRPGSGGITDAAAAANRLADSSVAVLDGIAPAASSAYAATSRSIVLEMSEDVASGTAGPGGFTVSVTPGTAPSVSSISVSGGTVTLALSGPLPGGTVSLGYDQGAGDVRDTTTSANQLASFSGVPVGTGGDITPPLIESATATSLDTITVTFDENVDADATDGSNWSLAGTDAGSLTISANTDPAGASGTMTLTLSGDLPDTRPDLTLSYARPSTGGVTDGTNQLESDAVSVGDGLAPAISAARAATDTAITLTISEPVADNSTTPGDFSLSGVASSPTVSSISVSDSTVTLALSGSILVSDSPALSYVRTSGSIHDPSSNTLADFAGLEVDTSADITPPEITAARATSLDTITVTFDENVDADATDGSNWSLAGTDAGSLTISANTDPAGASGTMTLTLSGDLPDTRPGLTLAYTRPGSGGITDAAAAANRLADSSVAVLDGIAPAASSAYAATSRSIVLEMSEDVASGTAGPGGFTVSVTPGAAPSVSSISVSGGTVTLALSGPLPGGTVSLGYDQGAGDVRDTTTSANQLASFSGVPVGTGGDIAPPEITSATATSLDTITVTFDENVDADATDGSGWSLAGTDAGSLTVSANTDPAGLSGTMTLTLSGDLPDTRPGLTLSYARPSTGGVTDGTNQLESDAVSVGDGLAPAVASARATTGTVVTLAMSEGVADNSTVPGDFSLSGVASSPSVSSISVSDSTVTLALSGSILVSDSPALSYVRTSGSIHDPSSNTLADFAGLEVDTSADITPPEITAARATSLDTITVTFDENVDADATDGSNWSLAGTDAGSLTVSANTDPAGASGTMTLTLSGDLPDTRPGLTLAYTRPGSGGITDAAAAANRLADSSVAVLDGIAPTVSSVDAATSRSIVLEMSEDVASGTAGPGGFAVSVTPGTAPSVSSISVSGGTVTLALSGPLPGGTVSLGYDQGAGDVRDTTTSANQLASFSGVPVGTGGDITPPSIESATATSLGTITVTFDENVDADATDGSNWSLAGTDAGSLTVSANTDPAGASGTMTLTLSGDLPDTRPDLTLSHVRPSTGGVTDGINQLESDAVSVGDGLAPAVASARATTGTVVTLAMSEGVADNSTVPGDFSLSGVASSPTVSSISVSGSTVTLALSSSILASDSPALSYVRTSGSIHDPSSNALADFAGLEVDTSADITPPEITAARATSLDTITVTFDENVDADATDGSGWSLAGTDAGSLTISANTDPAGASGTMTLTLSGDLPDTRPGLTLAYTRPGSGGITDAAAAANRLADSSVAVLDGIAPTVSSVDAATSRSIVLEMSEDVASGTAGPGGFTVSVTPGTAPSVSSISVSGGTVTLALSGPLPGGTVSLGYDQGAGDVRDTTTSANQLASFSGVPVGTGGDITPPLIESATATSLDTITVTFDENVDADATDGSNWSLAGTDAGSLTISANTDPAGLSGTMTLTLSGDLPDTRPGLTLSYARPSTGGVTDGTSQLESDAVSVGDGLAPAVSAARAATDTAVTLTISEPVADNSTAPGDFSLSGVASSPTVSSISVSGSTVTLALSGSILASDSPALSYVRTSGSIHDPSSNVLADFAGLEVDTSADITPPEITAARATSLDTITVTFDENVDADATDGSGWSLAGTDAGSLTISANTDPAGLSGTMTLTLSGDLPDTRPDLTLAYTRPGSGGITDAAAAANRLADSSVAVLDGIAPTASSVDAATSRSIVLEMSEDVASGTAGPGGFTVSVTPGTAPSVSSISVSGGTVTLALSGPLPGGTVSLGYDQGAGDVRDTTTSANQLASFSGVPVGTGGDITPPLIESATATSLDTITVTFDENVDADATDGSNWSLAGTDAGSLTVSANTDPAGLSGTMTLTLSDDLPNTRPDLTLSYTRPSTGGVTDGTNQLESDAVSVGDGLAPAVASARATTGTVVTLAMSEGVADNSTVPGDFSLSGVASSPSVSSISVSGSTVTLALSGSILASDSPALSYVRTSGSIHDPSSNVLADFAGLEVDTSADITPPLIESATATSLDTITVTFDENVDADATDGSNWSLAGTDAGSLTVSANTDPAGLSGTMTLTLSGDLPDTRPGLTLSYARPSTGGVTDGTNQLESDAVSVGDGLAPAVASARATTGTVVTLAMSEGVADNSTVPGDFSLSGVASSPSVSSISVSGSTVTLALSGSILASDSPALSYVRTSGSIHDPSSNVLADFAGLEVDTSADITPPLIESATATSLDTITVTFDENVDADATDGSNWSLAGTDAGSLTVSANTDPAGLSGTMTLTLSGDLPDTRPGLTLSYARPSTGGVTDGTNQLESDAVSVGDGLAPAVASARATTGTVVTLAMSEGVADNSTVPGDFSLSGVASSPSVSSISVSGSTVTLALSGSILASDSPALSYVRTSGSIHDPSSNVLADFAGLEVDTSADITPPLIESATATSLDTITVTFDENVDADATDGSNWSLAGTDAGSLTVSANTDPAGLSGTMTLTLSGDLPDTRPGLTLSYARPSTGGVTDGTNQLESTTVGVDDRLAPAVSAARAATDTAVTLTISEPVADNSTTPGDFSLSGVASSPTVSSISVSGSTVTLALSGSILASDSPALSYVRTSGSIHDPSSNVLADFAGLEVDTSADITPPEITAARATSLGTITVTFDENVDADATDGSNWSLAGTDAGSLTVSANTDPAGASGTMTLTLSGDLPDTRPDLTLAYTRPGSGGITDAAAAANRLADSSVAVLDGIAPTASSVDAAASRSIVLEMSEDVASGTAGPGGFTVSVTPGTAPSVSSISVSGGTVTLALSGPLPGGTVSLGYDQNSGNVEDTSDNPLASFTGLSVNKSADISPLADCTSIAPPAIDHPGNPTTKLTSAQLVEETGVLTVKFDTAIDGNRVDPAKFHIREAGSATGGITLSAADTLNVTDPSTISFTLGEDRRQAVIAMDTPRLAIDDSAVYSSGGDGFVRYMDISTAAHLGSVFDISQDSHPTGIAFSDDGTSMFITGDQKDRIYKYSLGSPFDVSSASFDHALNTSPVDKVPNGIAFSPDGTCMFLAGGYYHSVYHYSLNNAFDLASHHIFDSTPARSDDVRMQRISGGEFVVVGLGTPDDVRMSFFTGAPILSDVAFSGDGTRMFAADLYTSTINQYDLVSHFDISTASLDEQLDVSSASLLDDLSIAFGPGGTTLLVLGGRTIYQYDLDSPFDLSGATYAAEAPLEAILHAGVAFDDSGTRMFVAERSTNAVREYMLGPFIISIAPDDTAPVPSSATLQGLTLTATFSETVQPGHIRNHHKFSVYAQETATGRVGLSHIVPNISGGTVTFTLTVDEALRIANLTDPEFTIFRGAVQDTSGNYVSYHEIPLDGVEPVPPASDTTGPEFASGAMHRQDGLLTVTFDEPVDVSQVNVTGLTVTDGTGSVPLGGATLNTTLDSPTIAIQLTGGQRLSVAGLGIALLLDIASGAILDVSGNPIAASTGNALADSAADYIPPTVSSVTYNTNTGIDIDARLLTITFSEILHERVNYHGMRVGASPSQSVQLSDRSSIHDGATITARLAPTDQQTFFGTSPKLFVTASAVKDLADNDIVATTIPITLTTGNSTTSSAFTTATQLAIANATANEPPIVDAGSNQVVTEGSTVTLSGTASDADNDTLTYSWSYNLPSLTLSGGDTLSPSFTAPAVDSDTTVTFTLAVSDGTATVSDSLDVIIANNNAAPIEPRAAPSGPRDIGEITLASSQPGTIQATWEAPGETPKDYRIAWAKVGESFLGWRNLDGNAFPTSSSHTIAGLEEGEQYKVKVRARYDSGGSGDWSGVATTTVAGTG